MTDGTEDFTPTENLFEAKVLLLDVVVTSGLSIPDFLFASELRRETERRGREIETQRKLTAALEEVEYLWRP